MYAELLRRVISLETELTVMRAGNLSRGDVLSRIERVEAELHSVKSALISEVACERVDENRFYVRNQVIGAPVSPVLNPAVATREAIERERIQTSERRANVEFKIGKTVMSVLATVLILGSILLFGALVYPFLSDFAKVVVMYAVSIGLILGGLAGMNGKLKTFFIALAGCGLSAFYLSGVVSCIIFNVFGYMALGFLTYLWVLGVAYLSRVKVSSFAYICYVGILITTGLCAYEFEGSPLALVCYLVCIVTLYAFTRTKTFGKDAFYFVQAPIVLCLLSLAYMWSSVLSVVLILLIIFAVYVAPKALYDELSNSYKVCTLLTGVTSLICYGTFDYLLSDSQIPNVIFVSLSGVVAFWSYITFNDRFLRFSPVCFASVIWPTLNWGSYYRDYISYILFACVILALGYFLNVKLMKGIACGYFLAYAISPPSELLSSIFYIALLAFSIEFFILHWLNDFDDSVVRIGSMVSLGFALSILCSGAYAGLLVTCYLVAVLCSIAFNSNYFVQDMITMRLGFAWNGFWMVYGSGTILDSRDMVIKLFFFAMTLACFMVTAKAQIDSDNKFISLWLCLKSTFWVWMLLNELSEAGVVASIGFLLLAICGIITGAVVMRKAMRVYGLVLAIVSVLKCVLLDIKYSSSLYRPVGLLVAGLLCFGISWIYTVVERKLNSPPDEE